MEFNTQTSRSIQQIKTAVLFVGVYTEGVLGETAKLINHASDGAIDAVLKREFKAAAGTLFDLRALPGVRAERVVLVGLGAREKFNSNVMSKAHAAIAGYCSDGSLTEAVSTLLEEPCPATTLRQSAQLAATAAGNAVYKYTATFSKAKRPPVSPFKKLVFTIDKPDQKQVEQGVAHGAAIAKGLRLTRELGNLPANVCTPAYLGDQAKQLAKDHKSITAEVLERKQLEALKMNAFLSVAAGSEQPPRFIVLKYSPERGDSKKKQKSEGPVVLVGKGVTFDTGGISLKPGLGMDEMKFDMCGAASVLGVFKALAHMELDTEVIGLIPATENMPNGRATKPGDVVTSMSGQTIEILNTDAEGRLILCDALTYAERFEPAVVVDIATLTGACIVALGNFHSGLYASDDELADNLLSAGRRALDTAWRMPLDDEYQDLLKSNFADMANIGGPAAGSVTAACFLARYTKAYRWAHLDIAGTAWLKGGKDKGASGRPVPMLCQFLIERQAQANAH